MRENQRPKVFLSHSYGNQLVSSVVKTLLDGGIRVRVIPCTELLGTPSVREGLSVRIDDDDVFVIVLDENALESQWVRFEIEKAGQADRPIIPIKNGTFEIPEDLQPLLGDIPHLVQPDVVLLPESAEALVRTVNDYFTSLDFIDESPFQVREDMLIEFLETPERRDGALDAHLESQRRWLVRVIIDPDGRLGSFTDQMTNAIDRAGLPERERKSAAKTVRALLAQLDLAGLWLPVYRAALHQTLSDYGSGWADRGLVSCQRLLRLLVAPHLLALARWLPRFPEQSGPWAEAIADMIREVRDFERDSSLGEQEWLGWALQYVHPRLPMQTPPKRGEWYKCGFRTDGADFIGYLPAASWIADGIERHDPPTRLLELYEWSDYGLPQLMRNAVNWAESRRDPDHLMKCAWLLTDYSASFYPG